METTHADGTMTASTVNAETKTPRVQTAATRTAISQQAFTTTRPPQPPRTPPLEATISSPAHLADLAETAAPRPATRSQTVTRSTSTMTTIQTSSIPEERINPSSVTAHHQLATRSANLIPFLQRMR
jgi:hypothetical protein